MEQSLPIAANLLYQQASIVADAVLAEQRRTGSVPDVPADFQKKFYTFLDRINGHLMEDKDNFFGYFLTCFNVLIQFIYFFKLKTIFFFYFF